MEPVIAAVIGLAFGLGAAFARARLAPRQAILAGVILGAVALAILLIAQPGSTVVLSGLVGVLVGTAAGGVAAKPKAHAG